MEKTTKLLDLSCQGLIRRIVRAVRKTARTIPVFRDSHDGCVRITIVPLSQEADVWLGGGMSDFGESPEVDTADICGQEFTYKIDPRGSYTIQYVCDDGHIEPVNCYGYSALKTGFALWKWQFERAERKGELGDTFADFSYHQHVQFCIEENGWSTQAGAVYTTITRGGEDFACLCICTSGAESSGDEACSLAGMLEAQKALADCGDMELNPYIDGEKFPLKQVWRDEGAH